MVIITDKLNTVNFPTAQGFSHRDMVLVRILLDVFNLRIIRKSCLLSSSLE